MADYELAKKITLDVFYHAWETIKEFKSDTSYLLWIKDLAIKYSLFELNRDGLIRIMNIIIIKVIFNYSLTATIFLHRYANNKHALIITDIRFF